MEFGVISAFIILVVLFIIVAVDQSQQDTNYILGEEWDFTLPNSRKKS
jgi:uncharacterized integral membrane protein